MHQQGSLLLPNMARRTLIFGSIVLSVPACTNVDTLRFAPPPDESSYLVMIDEAAPSNAQIRLSLPSAPPRLYIARNGDAAAISAVTCADGRIAAFDGMSWLAPSDCSEFAWNVALDGIDDVGIDASLPVASYSLKHSYWLLPERGAFLRAANSGGMLKTSLRGADGRTIENSLMFPDTDQAPFYAVMASEPKHEYSSDGLLLRVFGDPPQYPWMESLHGDVLAQWATWRRDLSADKAPTVIDWVWVEASPDAEPGYSASAGSEAIVSQIKLRPGDPDAEAKARVIIGTSAAHEGFHTITGAAGQPWPAWVNESLASHFAITAAQAFLEPGDQKWLEAFYIAREARAPLLDAQVRYSAGNGDQAQVFYSYGARFWREIESVLTIAPNGSGRLAALIAESDNFSDIDLNSANELASFLDRHSDGKARPIVRCFLLDEDCAIGIERSVR